MYFKKLKILYHSDEDNKIYTEYRKKYFSICDKKVVFSSLEVLNSQFYHMRFSNSVEFPVLKKVYKKSFNGCVFNKLSLKTCNETHSNAFSSCKIEDDKLVDIVTELVRV